MQTGEKRDRTWRLQVCLLRGMRLHRNQTMLMQPKHGSPFPPPTPSQNPGGRGCTLARRFMASPTKHTAREKRLQQSQTMYVLLKHGFPVLKIHRRSSYREPTRLAVSDLSYCAPPLRMGLIRTITSPCLGHWVIEEPPHDPALATLERRPHPPKKTPPAILSCLQTNFPSTSRGHRTIDQIQNLTFKTNPAT